MLGFTFQVSLVQILRLHMISEGCHSSCRYPIGYTDGKKVWALGRTWEGLERTPSPLTLKNINVHETSLQLVGELGNLVGFCRCLVGFRSFFFLLFLLPTNLPLFPML